MANGQGLNKNMNIVVEVISEYLQTNRRLVVPGFGAFVVKESGERIFSDLLRTDDGVLASLLSAKGLSEMESAIMIDRFIFKVRHELEQYGYCRMGEVGTLRVEPSTKCLRLYPQVQGELPKAKPYIPQPIVETESKEVIAKEQEPECPKKTSIPNLSTPIAPKTPIKPRKKFDFVVVVAVLIVLAAIAAIGYGYYVSTLAEGDDAAMEALRITPEQIENR